MFPRVQKFKCPKCGKTKMGVASCDAINELCPKCLMPMRPCDTNWLDKLLGNKNYSDMIKSKFN